MDQNGNPIFKDYSLLEIAEPQKPFFEVGQNLREAFYGTGKRYRTLEFKEIQRKNWVICKMQLSRKHRPMFPGQTHFFILIKDNAFKKGMMPLAALPKDLFIRYDTSLRLIRLEGLGAGYSGVGLWKKF